MLLKNESDKSQQTVLEKQWLISCSYSIFSLLLSINRGKKPNNVNLMFLFQNQVFVAYKRTVHLMFPPPEPNTGRQHWVSFFCRLPLGVFLQHFFIFYFYFISSLSLSFSKNYLELPRVRAVLSKPTSLYLKLSECACILNDSKELSLRSVVVKIQMIFVSSLWEDFGCGLQADCWLVNAEGEEIEAFSLIGSE